MKPLTPEFLKKFVLLESLSDQHLKLVASHAEILEFPSGEMVFKRAQPCKHYYYLIKGALDLLDAQYRVSSISANQEKALYPLDNNDPHKFSAVSKTPVSLFRLCKNQLDLSLTWDQAENYLVEEINTEEPEEEEIDWLSSLLSSSLFQQIPPGNLQQLFIQFKEKPILKGHSIIKEGEEGDTFYVIKNGMAQVSRSNNGNGQEILATLGPGQYFGEEALISNTVRNATVTMLDDGSVMYLGKSDFKTLLEEPVLHYITQEELDELYKSGRTVYILDTRLLAEIPLEEQEKHLAIPLPELRNRLSTLEKDAFYVLYPEGGRRAILGNYLLNQDGFQAAILKK